MSNNIIIETKLMKATHSVVVTKLDKFEESSRIEAVPLNRLPEQLVWFIEHYEQVEIFYQNIPFPRNGWRIGRMNWWPRYTVNDDRGGGPKQYPYFEDVWLVASYAFDGGELIAADLHPGSNFGHVGWVTQTDIDYGGGAIVIAKTFFEWLERTLDHGPDAQRPYWREKGFKDYGLMIPDDPYYKPA